jgi:diguanylate cyclase (GGDEF)-like protein
MATPWRGETPVRETADAAQKRARVLVVDDDPGIRSALTRLLSRDGLRVACVASGKAALAAFADRAPDLVVLDLGLSDLHGTEVCERIRARPDGADTPVIVLTGRSDDDAVARAFAAGASDFASKAEPLAAVVQRARFLLRARTHLVALRESEARLREAQQLAQLASWRYELETRALSGDAILWRVLGTARGALPRLEPAQRDALADHMRECLRTGRVVGGELRACADDGSVRALRYRMQLALGAEGEALALEGIVQDVSAWRRSEARVEFLVEHDAVTGLPNRAGLLAALARAASPPSVRTAESEPRVELGVVAIGLEGVARVAQTLGREAADDLMREAARRLADDAGSALVAHAGEAQLALLLPSVTDAAALLAAAEQALRPFDAPFQIASHEVLVTASAGAASFPRDGESADAVLRAAERALAQARIGGPRAQAHSAATSEAALRRFTLASRLRAAIERDQLTLHYQPKIALATGDIVGFEALMRWQEPELGLLPPAEFVPIAEESGLVGALGDWVLREACRQMVAWRDAGLGDVPVAVNLSAQHFRRGGVAARVAEILRASGAHAAQLGIEITESVLLDDADRAIRELRALRDLGVELALDDFGTGFSSLSYLRKLPVQVVKIDREFIREISVREDAAALTASIVAMAKALWLRVVAEGVEKDAERDLVSIWGCEEAQGFLFSAPVDAEAAERLWRARGCGSQRDSLAG